MKDLGTQIAYRDTVGATKTFTHPLHVPWLTGVNRTARVLDHGCGYGRVMAELSEHGFSDVSGVDLSPALIARGRRLRPDLRFSVLKSPPGLPCAPESFDVVLLFAVLTCIPDDDAQRALATEVNRLLTPGGLLYVSDMVLQDDERIPAPATLPHQAAIGYVTGDLVRAAVPLGWWAGTWTGHVSVRARGQHSLTTPQGRLNVSHWNLRLLQRGDGYGYSARREAPPQAPPKNS
ncbi:class I SAM-dependent methyltransferase [Streptomyces sasae]|uniref:class I SAM-dependent methyltransferase n=1 Tax=Streptomyces sasae TaxID=1266772 RepID=UPI00292DE1EA|nr:class I SAM-dependent methyltransferase [Streptomyces sasae]